MKEQLIFEKNVNGKYCVRPVNWAGIWNEKGELFGCNELYEFETEEECINCINMSQISVFKMNDYEWWASRLSIEETEKYYEKEIGEENEIEDIKECDIDKEGMWWDTEDEKDIKKLGENDECVHRPTEFGDLRKRDGEVYKYLPFRLALMKSGEIKEPFCIASTEW